MAAGIGVRGWAIAFITTAAPLFAPQDPDRLNPVNRLQAPSSEYWFGTDQVGREVYPADDLRGAASSLMVGFSVAALSMAIGTIVGLTAALLSGRGRHHHALHGRPDGLFP